MAEGKIQDHRGFNVSLKSKQKLWREPQPPVRYAYLKLLREHDKTRRVYDINPYAEVYQFRDNLYGIYTESLDGMGDVWSYLTIGPEKAFLVDTGFGVGDLKGLCNELTGGMELIVACTHAHFDHAYGNCQFDRVYCSEFEVPGMNKTLDPHIWDYLYDENGVGIWCDFDINDIVPYKPYEIVGCKNNTVFDLGGGYEIELFHTGGHSAGHAMYLDHSNRVLFAGDDACYGNLSIGHEKEDSPIHKYATVQGLRDGLAALVARSDEFDGIFPGHVAVDIRPLFLESILEACEAVLADPESYDAAEVREGGPFPGKVYKKMIFESGYLIYRDNNIR